MVDEVTSSFIKDVGFPIAAFVMMLLLYLQSAKMYDKRQSENDKRYKELVDNFIQTVELISREQTKALEELSSQFRQHVQQKDALIEMIKEMRNGNVTRR